MAKDLVIGDMHFGIKTNNVSWMTQQLQFIREYVMPKIAGHDRVVFLGDLFDVRYSVNTQVGCEVKQLVREMLKKFRNVKFFFVAGNHDYYSPIMDFEKYNAYELVFGEEFVASYDNLYIISSVPYLDGKALFLPWYFTENDDRYAAAMDEYRGKFNVVYCHTDCEHWSASKAALKGNAKVYSGHIHYPYANDELGLYNIGAACAFTFSDVNSQRYIYTIEDGSITASYQNDTTPKFHRYYNDRIFTLTASDLENAYTQLCISKDYTNKALYIEQIKYIKTTYTNCDIKVVVIDESVQDMLGKGINFNANIQEYIKNNMPKHLVSKYELLSDRISQN